MATKKTANPKKKAAKADKPAAPRKRLGEVALVLRVPKEAIAYVDQEAKDRPRTVFLREILSKGDAKLGKILSVR